MRRALVLGCLLVVICIFGTLTAGVLGYGWWTVSRQVASPPTPLIIDDTPTVPSSATTTPHSLPSPSPTSTVGSLTTTPTASPMSDRTGESGETLSSIEQAMIPVRDLYELGIRFGKISTDTPRALQGEPPTRSIGDTETFRVSNIEDGGYFTVTAVLQYETAHAYWWVEEGYQVSDEGLRESAELFENETYPTNRAFFGSEWRPGIDGEEPVHIFLGNVPGVGGYYSSADEFPRAINPFSNEKEMFYINLDNARPGDAWFDGILAHEFQHMIHWNQDRNEEIWVNEGLSELAVRLNNLGGDRAVSSFLRDPDLQLTHWVEQTSPYYGASYLFMGYLLDRLGEDAMRALVQEPANGTAGIDAVAADQGLTFEALFSDWVVANFIDDPDGGRYAHPAHQLARPGLAETHATLPVLSREGDVHQFGTDYIRFAPDDRAGTLTIDVTGTITVPVVPTTVYSGDFAFWSNQGDDSDSQLTRSFDLRNVERATLQFWAWYDIEVDYDYAYVTISEDGGDTWRMLPAEATTRTNPHGNAFGPGYTGTSGAMGDDDPAEWVDLNADLSPYAGQEVLVRFEYITDDALHGNGFLLDDVSIPELGYSTDFEADSGGWEPAGWVRIDNVLQQHYVVQALLRSGDEYHVEQVPLDATNSGRLEVAGFGTTVDEVVLVVSGATPVTTNKASYTYSARIE